MCAVLVVARVIRHQTTLLVLGLMFSYITSAVVSVLMHFAASERIQAYFNWSFGSFNGVTGSQVIWFVPAVVAAAALAFTLVKPLDALLLGDQYARSMGVHVGRVRLLVVAATALLTGVVTAFCGPVGFLGIAVPHMARHLFHTAEHRILIPGCLFLGGITALLAAFVAEVPGSSLVLPLNAILALIGAPVVIWVLLRRQNALA
jgi:iron complex transport system permease protein